MKKTIVISIFLVGLGVFLYPIVSNFFSTKEHHSIVSNYGETIEQMEAERLEFERKKAREHNEKLAKSEVDFVDPFSKHQSESSGNKSYYDALNINPAIGSIRIPKINLELPIYHGTDEKILSRGVGHLENSSLPTKENGSHSVLTAHRGLPSAKLFRNLDQLTVGDQFFVQVLDEILAYEVQEINIVLPHETEWLQMEKDKNLVTLLTCEPYMINSHRMLVTGQLIPYEENQKEWIENKGNKGGNRSLYVVSVILIVAICLGIWLIWRRKQDKVETG